MSPARIRSDPRNWVAQPILDLSTAPTLVRGHRAPPPRPPSVRPHRQDSYVTAAGLTRVALREGSLIVNSSQGGGSKDTWIVDADETSPRGSRRHRRSPNLSVGRRRTPVGRAIAVAIVTDPDPVATVAVPSRPRRRRRRRRRIRLMALLSPVAERLYWGARYIDQRWEDARGCCSPSAMSSPTIRVRESAGVRSSQSPGPAGREAVDTVPSDEASVVHYLVADREHPNSIAILDRTGPGEPAHVP